MQETHKIAIFFDGTWNTVDYPEKQTNVKKMKDCIIQRCQKENILYITDLHYMEGPGTRPGKSIIGGAFAGDLDKIINDTCIWVSQKYCQYQKTKNFPEIYIFGFSRGAYLAHIFSWYLNDIGITNKLAIIPKLTKYFMEKNVKGLNALFANNTDCTRYYPVVRMLGLWDRVTAPFDKFSGYNDYNSPPIVKQVYHAMALDEKRMFFPVLKYRENTSVIHQRWFSGVHSDIGGGYNDSTLSDIALNWMIEMAINEELLIKDKAELAVCISTKDFINIEKHDESGKQNYPRKYEGEDVDDSVYSRMGQDSSYVPLATNFSGEKHDSFIS